jgi:hypothetical protein
MFLVPVILIGAIHAPNMFVHCKLQSVSGYSFKNIDLYFTIDWALSKLLQIYLNKEQHPCPHGVYVWYSTEGEALGVKERDHHSYKKCEIDGQARASCLRKSPLFFF